MVLSLPLAMIRREQIEGIEGTGKGRTQKVKEKAFIRDRSGYLPCETLSCHGASGRTQPPRRC